MRTCCFPHTNIPDTSFLCSLLTSILGTCTIYQVDFGKAVLYKNCNVSGKPTQAYNLLMVSRVFWQLKSSDQQRPPSTDFLEGQEGCNVPAADSRTDGQDQRTRWPLKPVEKVSRIFFGGGGWIKVLVAWGTFVGMIITGYPHARNRTSPCPHPQTHRISRSWRRLHGRRSSQGFAKFYFEYLKCLVVYPPGN